MAITSASFAYDEGIKQHGRGNRVWTRRSADLHGFMYLWCKGGLRDLVRGAEEGGRDINKVVGNSLVGKLPSL